MLKKIIIPTLILGSLVVMSGCTPKEKDVVTSKLGNITETELNNELKDTYGKEILQNLVVEKILDKKYGDKVSDDVIKKELDETIASFGGEDAFTEMLSYYGFGDIDSYRDSVIKQSVLLEELVKDNYEVTDDILKEQAPNYVKFSIVQTEDEETAKDVIARLDKGDKFEDVAKEKSSDALSLESGGVLGWLDSSTDASYSNELFEKVKTMTIGETLKEPFKDDYGYYVIRLDSSGSDISKVSEDDKKAISEAILEAKTTDSEYISSLLAKLIKENEFKVTDEKLEKALDNFTESE